MVARVLLTAQEAGAFKIGEPVRSILARATGPGTGGGELLGGIALTAFVVTDSRDRPARDRLAVGQDKVDARGRAAGIAATHHAIERDRKSVVEGKSVSVRVDIGCSRIVKKKHKQRHIIDNTTYIQ